MEILKLFDHTTNTWKSIPAIKGENGDPGDPGVWYGSTTPSSGYTVWVNPSGTAVNLFDMIYPIGSIYMSVNNVSPANLFGGTWVQIKDTFLLSAGDTYTAGDTGGEASHTLTKSELPAERLKIQYADGRTFYWTTVSSSGSVGGMSINSGNGIFTEAMGSGTAHNNMPPYLVVYVWQRTA